MRIRFWGTRGSIAKPGPDTVRFGGNTSCVEVRSDSGILIVLDCGTGGHGLGTTLLEEADGKPVHGHLLVGHTHWDHIQGLPFFAPLFEAGNEWHIYGPRGLGPTLREVLAGQMQYAYFPLSLQQLEARVHYHDLVEGTLDIADIRLSTHYLNHPALTLGYRIETDGAVLVYASDHEPHSREWALGRTHTNSPQDTRHVDFLADADLLIHDTQYLASEYEAKRGWGHSTVEYAVDCAAAARVKRVALFHHDPTRSDDDVERLVALARERARAAAPGMEVFAAAEGTSMQIAGGRRSRGTAHTRPAIQQLALEEQRRVVLLGDLDPAAEHVLRDATAAEEFEALDALGNDMLCAKIAEHRPAMVFLGASSAQAAVSAIRDPEADYAADLPLIVVSDEQDHGEETGAAIRGVTDWLVLPASPHYVRTKLRSWFLRQALRWQVAPTPEDEEARLASLHALELLDTAPEERFDRLVRLAAQQLDMPMAVVSLVDAQRQWFKAREGVTVNETPRDMAFCAHAILGDDIMQVSDAFRDDRFADNPLVTEQPRVRFYAGAPLRSRDGHTLGTLCVMDHRPRRLDRQQSRALRELARLVETELEQGA